MHAVDTSKIPAVQYVLVPGAWYLLARASGTWYWYPTSRDTRVRVHSVCFELHGLSRWF
jgi:hypothetical protein